MVNILRELENFYVCMLPKLWGIFLWAQFIGDFKEQKKTKDNENKENRSKLRDYKDGGIAEQWGQC